MLRKKSAATEVIQSDQLGVNLFIVDQLLTELVGKDEDGVREEVWEEGGEKRRVLTCSYTTGREASVTIGRVHLIGSGLTILD